MTDQSSHRIIGTVARVTEIIRYLAESRGEVAMTTIAKDLALPPSTVHRLLHLLMDQGFVERGVRFQSYRVGVGLYRLGCLISRELELAELADPIMRNLSARTGEFSMLCLYLPVDHALTLVHTVAAPLPVTYGAEMFMPVSIAWGASGRAVLASLSENEIREIYLETGPSPVTGDRLPPWPEFRAEMHDIKARGYAMTVGQKIDGAVGIACPVQNAAGRAVGSLCLTIPDERYNQERTPVLASLLSDRAAQLSRANGAGARSRLKAVS